MSRFDENGARAEPVTDAAPEIKLECRDSASGGAVNGETPGLVKKESNGSVSPPERSAQIKDGSSASTPSIKSPSRSHSLDRKVEEMVGGDITVKMEPGQPPKLARTASQKVIARPAQLFDHLPDSTVDATSTFQLMENCAYANKYMGYTEHAMECDCPEEWDAKAAKNVACGEDSDCINRATKMECEGDCGCGADCQNQRFQRREYAPVSVIKTEKKGFGLRADADLRPHQFIYEYIGEVINEANFRRRMVQYDEEGIKHFYFMSLSKGEFVDATRKGNLGRFCNHSCNPNCYVDKWVVGEKLRMGIFAERHIKAGEELVFNYNVDRYGADPQPCYCGEPSCTGFIGGKTQTERATKLSLATIEALGIDDGDGWDTAVAKRPRKKKTGEDDEEYVDSVQPKSLGEDGVTKVMAALMQCKEKWIAVKLLGRIQRCDDDRVINRVVKMHGYQILNSQLSTWKEDFNVVHQILDILDRFPRLTRNKIIDSKIEGTVKPLVECEDERVGRKAAALLEVWSTLEVGYRIPRVKRDPNATTATQAVNQFERRESTRDDRKRRSKSRSRSRSRSIDVPRGPAAQLRGPGGRGGYHGPGPRPFRRPKNTLPPGWFAAEAEGRVYYYSAHGHTTWKRPTMPAPQAPQPSKTETKEKALQDIIDGIMNAKEDTPKDKSGTPATPQVTKQPENEKKEDRWKSYSEEKQKRLYENTLFPHVKYVMDKFKHKLPREDLKRYAKEVAKKLVNSDFKNNRVSDPNKISEKQQKQVKKFCKEYFDKAVVKHRAYDKKRAERKGEGSKDTKDSAATADGTEARNEGSDDEDVQMSDEEGNNEDKKSSPISLEEESLKRKRGEADGDEQALNGATSPSKRQRSITPPPPPPPPMSPGDSEEPQTGDSLKRKRDLEDDDDSKDILDEGSVAKKQHSETPPPPPPPPPAEDTPVDDGYDETKANFETNHVDSEMTNGQRSPGRSRRGYGNGEQNHRQRDIEGQA